LGALAAADPGGAERASKTPLASETLFEEEPSRSARPSPPPRASVPAPASPVRPVPVQPEKPGPLVSPSIPRPIVSAQAAVRGTSAPTRARRSVLPGVSAVVGLAALAAGGFFVVRTV